MVEKKYMEEANKEIEDGLEKLIESMSGLNIEHERTLSLCYAEYFERKVKLFQQIEEHIRLLVRSLPTKAKDFKEIRIAGDVNKLREEFLFNATEYFDCIMMQGFGVSRLNKVEHVSKKVHQRVTNGPSNESKMKPTIIELKGNSETKKKSKNVSKKQMTVKAELKSTSPRGDNFCDFILKDDDCDNEMKVLGYGVTISKESKKLCNGVTTAKSKKNLKSLSADKSENDVVTIEIDEVDSFDTFSCYHQNSKFPPKLRFKRKLSLMAKSETTDADDLHPNEVKRRRET